MVLLIQVINNMMLLMIGFKILSRIKVDCYTLLLRNLRNFCMKILWLILVVKRSKSLSSWLKLDR